MFHIAWSALTNPLIQKVFTPIETSWQMVKTGIFSDLEKMLSESNQNWNFQRV